jgi:hypothetical protein
MKKMLALIFMCAALNAGAQTGIGTPTPKAALDITSANNGFLMPRVNLTATNVASPIVNPTGGALEIGTMVFNINTTAGIYGVAPGVYYWDGSIWVSQIHRYFRTNFTQTSNLRVAKSSGSYTNIPGLNGQSFTAPYTGEYQIIFSGYLGAGQVIDKTTNLSSGDIKGYAATGYTEGKFRLNINGINYNKYSYSISHYISDTGSQGSGGSDIYELFNEITIIVTVNLTAGTVCPINAAYTGVNDDNIETSPAAHVIGNMTTGLGNTCEVNVTYLGR